MPVTGTSLARAVERHQAARPSPRDIDWGPEQYVPALQDADVERVRALIRSVPPGQVTTYGDVARAAGLGNARLVGWILRTDGADLPWHRVVRADGSLAPHLAQEQARRLRTENISVSGDRVRLRPVRHVFPA